jgi:ferritin
MALANKTDDYLAQGFLQGFIDEQLEDVSKMDQLLTVIRRAGEKNLIMVEAYLVHIDKTS